MEIRTYIPSSLRFFYKNYSHLFPDLLFMKLQFVRQIQKKSGNGLIISQFESMYPWNRVHSVIWYIPEFIHPLFPFPDSTFPETESGFFFRRKKKKQKERDVYTKSIPSIQEDEIATSGHSIQNPDKLSLKKNKSIPVKQIPLSRVKYSLPKQIHNPSISVKWMKSHFRKKDSVHISPETVAEEKVRSGSALPVFIRDKKPMSGPTFRLYKKKDLLPFVLVSEHSVDKPVSYSRPARKTFPAIEFTHKPTFSGKTMDSKQFIRDPQNPHRYTIRERLIPSVSTLTNQVTLKVDSYSGEIKFRFPQQGAPEYIRYFHIFHDDVSNPLGNLLKYNYFRNEFVKDVRKKLFEKTGNNRNRSKRFLAGHAGTPRSKIFSIDNKSLTGSFSANFFPEDTHVTEGADGVYKRTGIENKYHFWRKLTHTLMSFIGGQTNKNRKQFPERTKKRSQEKSYIDDIYPFHPETLLSIFKNHSQEFFTGNPDSTSGGLSPDSVLTTFSEMQQQGIAGMDQGEAYHAKMFADPLQKLLNPIRKLRFRGRKKQNTGYEWETSESPEIREETGYSPEVIVPAGEIFDDNLQTIGLGNIQKAYQPLFETNDFYEKWKPTIENSQIPESGSKVTVVEKNGIPFRDVSETLVKQSEIRDRENTGNNQFMTDENRKKIELELFFKQHVPEAFEISGGINNINIMRDRIFEEEYDNNVDNLPERRQRLLIELSERIWDHVKKKIRQG